MFTRGLINSLYLAAAVVALPFIGWRWVRHGKRTPALAAKLTGRVARSSKASGPRVWIHAVSVGEVLQVRPLIRELRSQCPGLDVVLSTTTASGLKVAAEKYADCTIVPFPFDFSWAVRNAFERIEPDVVCLVELELWPNFIAEANRRGVPLLVANGRLSEKSHRGYTKFRRLVNPMFGGLAHVCSQNETYASRFASLGVLRDRISVTGSIKFDGLATDRTRPEVKQLREAFGFSVDDRIFVAGSTHDPEESIALDAWKQIRREHPDVRLVLVPRHPERFDAVAEIVVSRGFDVVRRSEPSGVSGDAVRLLDTLGELSACWGLADFAFVGGTLTKRGGQNMLEPAAYGCPVFMGPNTWNFADIAAGLLRSGGAGTVVDADDLAQEVTAVASAEVQYENMSKAARTYAASQTGAARQTADVLLGLMNLPVTTVAKKVA